MPLPRAKRPGIPVLSCRHWGYVESSEFFVSTRHPRLADDAIQRDADVCLLIANLDLAYIQG